MMRFHFFRRIALLLLLLFMFTVAISTVAFLIAARLLGTLTIPSGWEGAVRGSVLVLLGVTLTGLVVTLRGFRRIAAPIGDVMDAAAQVAEGDYSVRVTARGPREFRPLARAFNTMAERLQRHEEQRRDLLADVSHELRTPLAVIQGNLEGLLDGVYPRDDAHLAAVVDETRVLARLVDDLRVLAAAEDPGFKLVKAPANLGDLASETVAAFRTRADAAGVWLGVEIAPGLPAVVADAERMRQVLTNLIDNALRYTPSGGVIRVACAPVGADQVVVSVADTGTGISGEDLERIFDRFFKTRDSRGAGLGLAIAKRLVTAHEGTIRAESVPGQGTKITFTVPIGA